jgi:iron complex outermembrane receptor protein
MARELPSLMRAVVAGAVVGILTSAIARPTAAEESPAGQLEEVVVTAQKRVEAAKDVPASISVLGQAELTDHNIRTVEDITRAVPSISFNAGGSGIGVGVGETNIEIRGVSSSSGASTVGVYFDDVAVNVDNKNGVGAPAPMLFDLSRVEVLRGPQGTLFGASSEGGTVRYVFNPAKINETSGEASGEFGGTHHGGVNYQTTAILNVPVVADLAALRVDFGYARQSGWIDNYSLDGTLLKKGVNDNETVFARLAATIQPNDALAITPQVIYQQIHSSDTPVFYLQDTAYYLANSGSVPPPLPTDGLYRQHKEVAEPSLDTVVIPSLNITYNLGRADLTSVTSYYYRPYHRVTDGTTFDSYIIAVAFLGRPPTDRVIATLPSPVYQPVTYRTFSEEVRLASHTPASGEPNLKWVVGAYYNDQSAAFQNNDYIPGLSATFQNVYGYGINSPQSPLYNPQYPDLFANDAVYLEIGRYDTKQYALFGQVDYEFLARWHAGIGLRETHADTSTDVVQGALFAVGNFAPFSKTEHFNSLTPKASIVYDVTTEATVYASIGKGFRLGGELYTPLPVGPGNICAKDELNAGLSTNPTSSFDSDHLWSYELGSKGRALGNALSFDVAGYYLKWQNLQQAIYLPTCGYYDTINIGNAESYGAELELHFKLDAVPGLVLSVNGGLNHATLTSSTNLLAAQPGQHILYTPRWTATASIDYRHALTEDVRGFLSIDYDYTGESNGSYTVSSPNYINAAYGIVNLALGVEKGSWQIALFAKNLLNNDTIIQSPTINSLVEGYSVQPMTAGLRVTKKF